MSVQFERDERKFDFHDIGLAIKRAREAKGMTQEQLACIIDRDPRTVMYNENDGQHPSLNTFYQMVTMFDISVDQFFYPDKGAASGCKSRCDAQFYGRKGLAVGRNYNPGNQRRQRNGGSVRKRSLRFLRHFGITH